MPMMKGSRYSIKQYLMMSVISVSIGYIGGAIMLSILGVFLGFGSQAVLLIILASFPVILFSSLYGFYKGLIRYYGFKGDEKLFFNGKI